MEEEEEEEEEEEMILMIIDRQTSEEEEEEDTMELSSFSHKKPITLPIPTWKMYENPLYTNNDNNRIQEEDDQHDDPPYASSSSSSSSSSVPSSKIHILHLPISARKIAASFWDLSTSLMKMKEPVVMESSSSSSSTGERRWRKKLESHNKKLGRELSEERKRREAVERVCAQLAGEVSEEMCRFKMEMEEERKMMRMADLFREERLRIKLAEARFIMEDQIKLVIHDDEEGTHEARIIRGRDHARWMKNI